MCFTFRFVNGWTQTECSREHSTAVAFNCWFFFLSLTSVPWTPFCVPRHIAIYTHIKRVLCSCNGMCSLNEKYNTKQRNRENRNSPKAWRQPSMDSVLLLSIPLHLRSRSFLLLLFHFVLFLVVFFSVLLPFIHFFEDPCVNRTHMRTMLTNCEIDYSFSISPVSELLSMIMKRNIHLCWFYSIILLPTIAHSYRIHVILSFLRFIASIFTQCFILFNQQNMLYALLLRHDLLIRTQRTHSIIIITEIYFHFIHFFIFFFHFNSILWAYFLLLL